MIRCIAFFVLLLLQEVLSVGSYGQNYRLFSTENGLTSSLVNCVFEDRYGQIWIATEDGLNRYDGVKITSYKHLEGEDNSLASNYVSTLNEDRYGNLIVSTYSGMQIYRYDTDDFSPRAKFSDGKTMKANISNLLLEKDGRLYGIGDVFCEILTEDRDRLLIRKMKTPYFSNEFPEELPQNMNFRSKMRYDDNHLLLGTDGDGVKLYNEKGKTIENMPLDIPDIPQKLQKVHHLMRDRRGNLWLALYQRGVVMVSWQKSMFGYLGAKSTQQDIIGSRCVQALEESRDGGMWIGTDGDGLYYVNNGKSRHFTEGIAPMINTLLEDSEGTLWVGSYNYPCYKGVNGSFSEVKGLPVLPRVFSIKEDHEQNVWLGTMGHGVYCYSRRDKTMKHIEYEGINNYVNCLYVLSNGDVLAGTFNGVFNISKPEHLCPKLIVYSIFEDRKERLWLGSSEGLVVLNKGKQKIYTTADGMSSNTVFAINEDVNGKLWFSSNSGLSCFDEHEGIFTNYSVRDGLQSNEFSKGAVQKAKDGSLWFGGHEGVTYFSASNVSQIKYNLHPRITALYINDVPVNVNTFTGGKPVVDAPVFDAHRFSIAYENNSFSVEISAAEIDRPAECTYCYSMDGGNWISIPDGGHIVSFSNLDAGIHKLRYAVEYNGRRSEAEEVSIEVRHPWWGSLWVKCLICLVVVTIATLLYFWIRSREKVKALALISHKIRTPMSLIISPLIQLIDDEKDEERQKTYRMMLRSAEKLQSLAAQATEEEPIGPIETVEIDEGDGDRNDRKQSRTTRQLVIVEDDDEVRRYLCEQLSPDYHVREAANGKEAFTLIFQKQPDAIISDVTMPEMDGITLCRRLKKNIKLAHIPVVLLTARADEESTLQGLGIGADAYITKPFNIKILRQTIINLIMLRQQLKNTYQDQLLQEDKQKDVEAVDYEDQFMQRLMDCINRHLGEKDFSIEKLCEEVGISRAQLHRRLKERTNQSTSIFIRNVRLHQAAKLLTESEMRVSEVADAVGFVQITYFCNAFKELYGVTPTEFRGKE